MVAANSWGETLAGVGETAGASPLGSGAGDIFERHQDAYGSSVQFGDMSPVDFNRARARASLARERSTDGRIARQEWEDSR